MASNANATTYALGIGGGLIGAYMLYRWWQKDQAAKRLDELRRRAMAGEITSRQLIDAIMADGAPVPKPGEAIVSVNERPIPTCDAVAKLLAWPTGDSPFEAMMRSANAAAIANLKREGKCT